MSQGNDRIRAHTLTGLMAIRLQFQDGAQVTLCWATGETITYVLLGIDEDEGHDLVGMRLTRPLFGAEYVSADRFRKGEVVVVYRD